MIATHRRAVPADAPQLLELRRRSITILAPQGMPIAEVESWATNLSLAGMEQKIHALEVWIAEIDGRAAGWGAIRGDRLEGLYTDPDFAHRGIGTELLGKLEALMRAHGICRIERGGKRERRGVLPTLRLRVGRGASRRGTTHHQATGRLALKLPVNTLGLE